MAFLPFLELESSWIHCIEKSSMNILQSLFFCVSQDKESQIDLEWVIVIMELNEIVSLDCRPQEHRPTNNPNTSKFAQKLGGSDVCPRCSKAVYAAEKVIGAGNVSRLQKLLN